MSKTRVGIIGCGGMATGHALRFEKVKDHADVTAVVDIDIACAQAVADLLPNSPRVAKDYREILGEVDALLVVLPHHLHHSVSIDCMDAGKHVLVEKPMANSEQECIEMLAAAERNQRVLMVAYCMRFHPLVRELHRLIKSGTYGELFELSIWTEQYTHPPEGHWARSQSTLGGGQLFSHGCHYVDLLLWFLGRPVRGSHFGTRTGTPWMEREGTSHLTIEFEGGILGYHGATWGARGTRLGYSVHAHCTEGMLEADIQHGVLYAHSGADVHEPGKPVIQKTEILLETPSAKPTDEEMIHFLECIRTGAHPLTDGISSLEGLRVIWELYRAEEAHQLADLRGMGLGSYGTSIHSQ